MAFVHGQSTRVYVGAYDLSGYLTEVSVDKEQDTIDTTTFGSSGVKSYIAGMVGASFTASGLWDATPDSFIEGALGGEQVVSICFDGATIGDVVHAGSAIITTYGPSGSTGGAVSYALSGQADLSMWRGVSLHALSAETSTGTFASVDNSASSSGGVYAHLHVTGFTGTNATILVEDSPDDSNWSTLGTFSSVTGATAEQIAVSGTVDRYLRVNLSAGTFSSITFHVNVARR